MTRTKKAMAASAVALLLAVTMSAVMAPTEEAEAGPWIDEGTGEAIDWWLRVIPGVNTVKGIYDFMNSSGGSYETPAGADEAMKAYARNVDALRSAEQMHNLYGISANLVRTDTETWKLTDAFLNRAAEIAAGSLWYEGARFDADATLQFGGIYESIGNGSRNTSEILDEAVRVSANLKHSWDSTEYGGPLNVEMIWDGGTTGTCSDRLLADFFTLAAASSGRNVVYLVKSETSDMSLTSKTVWAYTSTGTITPIAPGSPSMPLALGPNDVSHLPSGLYVLSPGTYGGPFISAVGEAAAPVRGAMGIIRDTHYGYAIGDGGAITVYWNGVTSGSRTLDLKITGSDDPITAENALFPLVTAYSDYMDRLTQLLFEAAQSAQIMWTISATAHSSNILLSPSSIIPHLKDMDIGAEQSYAMYVMALDQIGQYNSTYGGKLRDGMTRISAQSLDLYCHGSIHAADGMPIAENVIFSPYIYVQDWTIYSGRFNTLTQDGMAMVWDTADTTVGWDGAQSSAGYQSILLKKGMYFVADEIQYKGALVPSVHLDVEEVQQIDIFRGLDWDRPEPPRVLSAEQLIMVIVIELGAIVALLGYAFKIPQLMIAGAIVALLGFVLSGWIARVVLGAEGFWDWLPFMVGGWP